MEQDFRRIFQVLISGTPGEFKAAKKEIERLWHHNKKREFQKHAPIALEYIKQFDNIKSPENRAAFASGLSLFFFCLSDKYFDVLKNFVLKVIQSPDGHTREAIRKTADWLYISLTDRMEPFTVRDELTQKQEEEQKIARKQHLYYVKEIEDLIAKYATEEENLKEYINELKPSIYKSLQMLWSDLNRGQHIYLDDNPSEEIIAERKEIENELVGFLKKTGSDFNLDDIKETIYYEEGADDMTDIIAMFDTGQGAIELQNIIEIITDAWNYFPHKTLGGKCPHQMIEEYRNKAK